MVILSGDQKIQALGAFEEHAYQDGESRRVLRLRLNHAPAPEQLTALCSGTVSILDDAGYDAGTFEGYNSVHECYLTLAAYTPAEAESVAVKTKAADTEAALAVEKAKTAAAMRQLSDARAELSTVKAERAALQRQVMDHASKTAPLVEEGSVM